MPEHDIARILQQVDAQIGEVMSYHGDGAVIISKSINELSKHVISLKQHREPTMYDVIDKACQQFATTQVDILEQFNRDHPHPKGFTKDEDDRLASQISPEADPRNHEGKYAQVFRDYLVNHIRMVKTENISKNTLEFG